MAKIFTHIGAAVYRGKDKFRFTNGRADARVKTMTKAGFEKIEFLELPGPMTKQDAFKTDIAAELAARRGLALPTADVPEVDNQDVADEREAA